jgi:putative addiction module killer protein
MNIILKTDEFDLWFRSVRDIKARIAIGRRIERAEDGNFGDHKSIGDGVFEMRIMYGAGYRVYYAQKNGVIYVLLCGGNKASQTKDIAIAKRLWQTLCTGEHHG